MSYRGPERWKKIDGWPYYISENGQVKHADGYILRLQTNFGYQRVCLALNGKKSHKFVHQLVCEAFVGKRPSKKHGVAHYDAKKTNNNYLNLRWATAQENMNDIKRQRGCFPCGENIGTSKLTKEKVIAILKDERSQKSIAKELGMAQSTIWAIRNRRSWKHLGNVQQPQRYFPNQLVR